MSEEKPFVRKFERKPIEVTIRLRDEQGIGQIYFDTKNLSSGGAFLKSDLLLEIGDEFSADFTIGQDAKVFQVRGRVVWINRGNDERAPHATPGMGVQFLDFGPDEARLVDEYLAQIV